MADVTITLSDAVLARVEHDAERRGLSVSELIADLVGGVYVPFDGDPHEKLIEFLNGPGFPGISKNLPTREELYAERDEELARRRGDRDV
jgi:hypothetical protein